MRRFWTKESLDKYSANPSIHQTLADAFIKANQLASERSQGDFAVFECIGAVKIRKRKKKPAQVEAEP